MKATEDALMTLKVLVVDDHPMMRAALRTALETLSEDVLVVLAGSLQDAFRQLTIQAQPDLVLLDLNLPGGSGLDLLPEVDRSRTRVLIMSAMAQQHKAAQVEVQGDAFLAKPFDPEVFTRLVLQLAHAAGGRSPEPGAPDLG